MELIQVSMEEAAEDVKKGNDAFSGLVYSKG